ncbi:MAG: hypothetical protein ABJC79_14710 [Acidimicrobiia bacterium]
MSKLTSPLRSLALLAVLTVVAAGCDKDAAQPWHYWLAPVLVLSAIGLVFVGMPLAYYLKVWRLKHRGR